MHIASDPIVVPPYNERRLAVRLEADHSVNHVDAGLLQMPGLDDVVLFIEPSLQLD